VPKNLRIGPWSKLASPTLALVTSYLLYHRPTGDHLDTQVSSYPAVYSTYWWYNTIGVIYMTGVVAWITIYRTKGALLTFTLLSWKMNALRHGINAAAPFLYDGHLLLTLNHILRFPALVSASITFSVWNFVLFPYVYSSALDTKEKKDHFLKWNFNVRMVQQHVCNIIYAVMNTVVAANLTGGNGAPPLFDNDDLWYGLVCTVSYGMFYTLILDRIGVHVYPVFSPRSNFVVVTWGMLFALHYALYQFWNLVMVHHWDILRLEVLIGLNFGIMFACAIVFWYISGRSKP